MLFFSEGPLRRCSGNESICLLRQEMQMVGKTP